MTGPGTGGRPRSARADRAILQAALTQLVDGGFARMSMASVAAAAGVPKSTVYRRYAGKEDLATAAVAEFRDVAEPPDLGDVRAEVLDLVRGFERRMAGTAMSFVGDLLVEERHNPELLRLFRERVIAPRREMMLEILRRGQARGEVRADADLAIAADVFIGSYFARHLSGEPIPADWAERVVGQHLAGLAGSRGVVPGA